MKLPYPLRKDFIQKWTTGPLIDDMELTLHWVKEARDLHGDTRQAGWSYEFSAQHRDTRQYSRQPYPTMLRAIEAAAYSYCEARESDAWGAWRDSQVWSMKRSRDGNKLSMTFSPDGPKP